MTWNYLGTHLALRSGETSGRRASRWEFPVSGPYAVADVLRNIVSTNCLPNN